MSDIVIDMNPVVGAIVVVMTEPYKVLLANLKADGRVTDSELEGLRVAILDRSERLAVLVRAELAASASNDLDTSAP